MSNKWILFAVAIVLIVFNLINADFSAFAQLSDNLTALGNEMGLQIRIQRSEIFDAMHRI